MKYSQFQGDPVPAVRAAVRAARVPVDGEGRGHLHDLQRRDELYKSRSSRKIDSRRLFSREYDFPTTFSLTEN